MQIQDLKNGDYFKKKEGAKKIFCKDKYCQMNKAWECTNVEDINDYIYIKKGKEIVPTDY